MKVSILPSALEDLKAGYAFYEQQESGLGACFLTSLEAAIDSLRVFAGVHSVCFGRYHRLLARRFPYAVYYSVSGDEALVAAVLDCRRDPRWIRSRLV